MARRRSKKPLQEDTSILVDSSSSPPSSGINLCFSPALLFIIFTVGASTISWFCVQQQNSLDQLSESFLTVEQSISNLQQVMETTGAQTDAGSVLVKRILALEEAQKLAEESVEVALETSEKMNNPDLYSQLWALRDEMDTRLAEMKRASLSLTSLQSVLKNQSEEFEVVKESVAAGLSFSSALAENVERLSDAVKSASSRSDEQIASVAAFNGQLDGQASALNQLKEATLLHNVALHTNNQELAAIKELVAAKRALRAQALEEMLSSVQTTLDEQFFSSQNLHSSVMAQLQTFHTQLAKAPSQTLKLKSETESPAEEEEEEEEEHIFTTLQNITEVEAKTEEQEAQDEGEEETEQLKEDEGDGGIEKQWEEEGTLAEEEEEITPEEQESEEEQEEEQEEVDWETAEEVTEDTVESHLLDETSEEEVSQEDKESWETVEEESAELESEVMDEDEDEE